MSKRLFYPFAITLKSSFVLISTFYFDQVSNNIAYKKLNDKTVV